MTDEDLEILNEFIAESSELLDEVETILLDLEKEDAKESAPDSDSLNKMFRAFHSMKGNAGFLDLTMIATLTHHAETLLDKIRKGTLKFSREHIGLFLEVTDFFKTVLEQLGETHSDAGFEEQAEEFARRLDESSEPKKEEDDFWGNVGSAIPIEESAPQESAAAPAADDFVNQFLVDSKELLDKLETDILALEKNPTNRQLSKDVFRNLHSLKGNAGLLGFQDIATVCHQAESYMETINDSEKLSSAEQINFLLEIVDKVRQAVEEIPQNQTGAIPDKEDLLKKIQEKLESFSAGLEVPQQSVPPKEEKSDPDKKAEEKPQKQTSPEQERSVPQTPPKAKVQKPHQKPKSGHSKTAGEVIRVDVNKLNKLMDLVGEIVIAESMVSNFPAIRMNDAPDFEKSINHLKKNIRELQELSTSMRMIPLSGLFRKMMRLVRDLSVKSGKKVELIIKGDETEMDRSVIEHISDPLIHIIRNAVDHGIEPTEERLRAGKNPVGQIILEAKQVGSEIWIIVQDDGGGLNREKILKKAIEKGLIHGDGSELPDNRVWPLIFKAGFSTADKITDISGRGVGMDVVLKNIEAIRGRVNIESKEGQGATFQLRIPLTTAIIDGMLLRVKHSMYAIPILDIRETIQVRDSNVVKMVDGQEILSLRDELIPILRIQELYHIPGKRRPIEDGIIVVAESSGMRVSIFVDEIIDQQQLVIKPIPSYLEEREGISGCSILGNGDICLVLDVANLIRLAEKMEIYRE